MSLELLFKFLPFAVLVVGLLVGGIVVGYREYQRVARWRRFVQDHDFEVVEEGALASLDRLPVLSWLHDFPFYIEGTWQSIDVRVVVGSRDLETSTTYRAPLRDTLPCNILVAEYESMTTLADPFVATETGIPEFDDTFFVMAEQPEEARSFLKREEVREVLCRLEVGRYSPRIRDGMLELEHRGKADVDPSDPLSKKILTDSETEQLGHFLDALTDTVHTIRESRADTRDDAQDA